MCSLFLFFTGRSLWAYYFDGKYARDDYRGLVQYIQTNRQPEDATILVAPGQAEIFGYYQRRMPQQLPIYPLPSRFPIDKSPILDDLTRIATKHNRVWLTLWAAQERDPDGLIEQWLSDRGRLQDDRYFGTVELKLYTLREAR